MHMTQRVVQRSPSTIQKECNVERDFFEYNSFASNIESMFFDNFSEFEHDYK